MLSDYQQRAARTAEPDNTARLIARLQALDKEHGLDSGALILAAFGLGGESGEFVDHIKKAFLHEHPLDLPHLRKELGDILWYIARAASAMGIPLETIAEENIQKLLKRYPEKFSYEASRNRTE